jgi:hypothetical protein
MLRIPLHWQIFGGMVIGAAVGLALNAFVSQRESRLPETQLPTGVREVVFRDSTNRIDIRVVSEDGTVRQLVVDESRREPGRSHRWKGFSKPSRRRTAGSRITGSPGRGGSATERGGWAGCFFACCEWSRCR